MMAYFDNAATTFPKPEEVYRFMDSFCRECGVNVGRGQHKLASRAAALVAETRDLLLELNHCPNKRVVFTPSATEALNVVLRGIGISEGWNIYVSPFEHNAVMRVLYHIGQNVRVNVRTLDICDLLSIHEQFATHKPHLVVMSHASNVCGAIVPVRAICVLSKPYGAVNIIDMAQSMGLVDTDLSGGEIDFAVFAGHKTLYGPFGVGGFICSADTLLEPLLYGGTGMDSANQDLPAAVPERYEVGSLNIQAISGLNAAIKWIQSTGIENLRKRETEYRRRLFDILAGFENIRVVKNGLCEDTEEDLDCENIGVVSCVFTGFAPDEIGQIMSSRNIAVRTGLHCAPLAHQNLGTFPAGTVRFSVGCFNTDIDFEHLEETLLLIEQNSLGN